MRDVAMKFVTALGLIIGTIQGWFLWAVAMHFAYKWISWNFNLPSMDYLSMVCMLGSLDILCGTFGKLFHKKS